MALSQRQLFHEALAYSGETTEARVIADLKAGLAFILEGDGYLAVCSVNQYPALKELSVDYLAGELHAVLGAEGRLLETARAEGCSRLTMCGRRGWGKYLRRMGWTFQRVTFSKEI